MFLKYILYYCSWAVVVLASAVSRNVIREAVQKNVLFIVYQFRFDRKLFDACSCVLFDSGWCGRCAITFTRPLAGDVGTLILPVKI